MAVKPMMKLERKASKLKTVFLLIAILSFALQLFSKVSTAVLFFNSGDYALPQAFVSFVLSGMSIM